MKFHGARGFTLIEAMIVIAITLTLSATLIGYNRTTNRQLVLFREQALLVGTLNRAKALAIEKFNSTSSCAFGVSFSATSKSFILFEDLRPQETQDCKMGGVYQGNGQYDTGEELQTFAVTPPLSLLLQSGTTAVSQADVFFLPPDPLTSSTVNFPVTIQVKSPEGAVFSVVVSGAGQITTQ